jgi:hypothetical protein
VVAWAGGGSVLGATRQQREPCKHQAKASTKRLFFHHTANSQIASDLTALIKGVTGFIECPVNESVGRSADE